MQTRRNMTLAALGTAVAGGWSRGASAAPGVFTQGGLALGGYDSAAYWTTKKAAKGEQSFSFDWNGVTWVFASQANRDAFAASPAKYAPAFNGYCPFCLAGGKLVPGVGNYWDISNGKLYLLLSARVRDDFIMKVDYYVERATAYWAKLS